MFQRYFFSVETYIVINIHCDPSLELSWRDGSNVGSQNMFLWRNVANYPFIIYVTPSYLKHRLLYGKHYNTLNFSILE